LNTRWDRKEQAHDHCLARRHDGGRLGTAVDFPACAWSEWNERRAALAASDLGALLLFDPNNIRYVTSSHIGEWARDKNARFVLLCRDSDPILWDFGSAARHHQLYAPWAAGVELAGGRDEHARAMPEETGVPDAMAAKIVRELEERGLKNEPLGVDMSDIVTLEALHRAGIATTDAQRVMLSARRIKTEDEQALLSHAAAIVDAVYERIYELLRPGVREHEIVAEAMKVLFELGSEHVEAINASRRPLQPHPHVFSDRLIRPGDQAFFDIIHSFMGYRTCYYRTFCVGSASQSQVDAYRQCRHVARRRDRPRPPGMTTDKIAEVWPTAEELGFPSEESCFGLQFGTASGSGCTRRR
jgi:Xaa-Pro aminopeptidase